jgi:DNA polymerase-1
MICAAVDRRSRERSRPNDDLRVAFIDRPEELAKVVRALKRSQDRPVGLDVETTGLDFRKERVRLLSIAYRASDGRIRVFVIDLFKVDPSPLWRPLAKAVVVAHNAQFDLQFLARLGFVPARVRCTMLMSQVLYASKPLKGRPLLRHGLADCADRELGATVDKIKQTSDWAAARLTPEQLQYAAKDASVLLSLYAALRRKLEAADLLDVMNLENRALPALVWLASAGVGFDWKKWLALAKKAAAESRRLEAKLNRLSPGPNGLRNWNSHVQVRAALAEDGHKVTSTTADVLVALDCRLARTLLEYRRESKLATTYGVKWVDDYDTDGRIYPNWYQLGANSGRMSCARPNLQNLPHSTAYRVCFVAPPGRVLVDADLNQVELRLAARIACDKTMMRAFHDGVDVHTLTAQRLVGRDDVTKDERTLAKSLNFGCLYGMGALAFRQYARSNYGVELSEREAERYRGGFFAAYPGLRRWHRRVGRTWDRLIATRTLCGRRCLNVGRFTEKLATPVSGSGADILKSAMALLWQRRGQVPGAIPVLVVHDEIVIEVDARQADAAAKWLRQAMMDAATPVLSPVPAAVEVRVSRAWGGPEIRPSPKKKR